MKCISRTKHYISIQAGGGGTGWEDYRFQNIWEKVFLRATKNIPKCLTFKKIDLYYTDNIPLPSIPSFLTPLQKSLFEFKMPGVIKHPGTNPSFI